MHRYARITGWSLLVATLVLVGGVALADGEKTLNGQYIWNNRGTSGDLEATFTPAGEGRWTVDFNFQFRGTDHTYSGTAEGSLESGELTGTVKNDNKKRTFTFKGAFADGKFEGTHAETTGGEPYDTGTLTLQ